MSNLTARQVFTHPVHFLAYGFGAGLSPKAPGTMGTLVAVPLCVLLMLYTNSTVYLIVLAAALVVGIFICGYTARKMGIDDPKGVVWDEIVGYLITMLGLPVSWVWFLAGFLMFRLFDIWKPWPIRWADRHIKGGFGIMFDDVIAAVFACVLLNLGAYFLKV
jgi:phosphatidylglycerophosphatase A